MQTEVGEAHEPPRSHLGEAAGLPHKRSPNTAAIGIAAATIAPNLLATIIAGQVQEHERGLGGWQAQWHAVPALLLVTSGALAAIAELAQGLEIDAERMRSQSRRRAGPDHGRGGVDGARRQARPASGQADRRGSEQAGDLASKRHLNSILAEDPRVTAHMTPGELARLFELMGYQGVAQTYIDRLIGSLGSRTPKRPS